MRPAAMSRPCGSVAPVKRMVIAASALLAPCGTAAAGAGAPATNASTSPVTPGGATTTPIGGGEAPPGLTAEVVSVLDGDSMRVLVSGREDELRLLGINAPEPTECFADEARSLLAVAAGEPIVIVGDGRDQFGRIVGYAYRGATNLNQWMLAQGGAIAMSTDHELFSDFIAAEQDAVLRGVGLWAPGVCTVAGGSAVFISRSNSMPRAATTRTPTPSSWCWETMARPST